MKKIVLTLLMFTSLAALAQIEDDNYMWMKEGRIQHIENFVTDATGTHRAPMRVGSRSGAAIKSTTGSPKIPVLLVQFADRKFQASGKTADEVLAHYELFFNGADMTQVHAATGSYASVSQYFMDMSQNIFIPDFDIYGPVTLDNGYAIYGANSGSGSGSGSDKNISAFYQEACSKCVKDFNINWNLYDNDNNGSVDLIFFIYAGWGENISSSFKDSLGNGMDPDAIWAKEGTSSFSVTTDDGQKVTFASYGCTAEARFKSQDKVYEDAADTLTNGYNPDNMKMDGVGVCIHELSHGLGLPDFYDTADNTQFGMDMWSIMDYGEYVQNGYLPTGYTAYEREFMNWETIPVLTEPQIVTLKCFADAGTACKVVNPNNINEYYFLENRQAKGWDRGICGNYCTPGLLITHVDYIPNRWTANTVNSKGYGHMCMTPVAANNIYKGIGEASTTTEYLNCLRGITYPCHNDNIFNDQLTDESTPAANVYNGQSLYSGFMGQPIRNITENEDGTITFCFRTNGRLATPELSEATDVSESGFAANWASVENATKYVVEMLEEEATEATCDTLTDLSRTYTELEGNTSYKYRVKAMADSPEDYIESEWSEYQYLTTDPTAITNVSDSENEVMVYALNGMPVSHCALNELHRLDLREGVYVLRFSNGTSRKVMLK